MDCTFIKDLAADSLICVIILYLSFGSGLHHMLASAASSHVLKNCFPSIGPATLQCQDSFLAHSGEVQTQ